jgi:hypothetical protein
MTARPPLKILDSQTADRLTVLIAQAKESTLTFSLDFCPLRPSEYAFIGQLFDTREREIISARGHTLAEVISGLHDRWLAKGLPG